VKKPVPGPFGPTDKPSVLVYTIIAGDVYAAMPKPPPAKRRRMSSGAATELSSLSESLARFFVVVSGRRERGMSETRKLAAVLVSDVAGYSRLAGATLHDARNGASQAEGN